jgi:predicted alpha/beta-hydrolase family hydrolase
MLAMAVGLRVVLGHGASGTAASMRPHVTGLAARGIKAEAIDLPKGRAERAVPVFENRIAPDPQEFVIGGHSYGGRVASMVAAGALSPRGLVLLSYPLHRPGHPEDLRVEHWPDIACPVLLLSGESDPFARVDLLREQVRVLLPKAKLVTYPSVGHGLAPVLDDALDHVADFVRGL